MISPELLHSLFETYGVWTVALIVGLESFGLPLPGESVLILASIYAATHGRHIALVIGAATLGAIIGDNLGYVVGRGFGYRLVLRFGSYLGLTEARIKLGQYLFMKHGGKVVFFGRFFAVLRVLAAFLAGVNRMAWPNFLFANALGGLVWATLVGSTAYALGRGIHRLQGPIGLVGVLAIVTVLAAIFVYIRRHEAELQRQADAALPGHLVGYRHAVQ